MRRGIRAVAVVGLVVATLASSAGAAEPGGPGAPALRQARAAWDRGALDAAEPLYREAIEKGGLAPTEVLEGYVRLGAIRASLGKKDQAIAAFRAASILDASFAVPSEAGPKGPALAERAKKDTAKFGSLKVAIKAPKETASGKSFHVTATIDAAHIPVVAKVALVAKDGTSGKETTLEAKSDEANDFEIPADLTLPNAALVLRFDALDRNANRLGSAEEHVKVLDSAPTQAQAGTSPSTSSSATRSSDENVRKGGSFWSSPWPYLIGGVALVGAGTAVYFGTRPSDDVSVGQIGVRTR